MGIGRSAGGRERSAPPSPQCRCGDLLVIYWRMVPCPGFEAPASVQKALRDEFLTTLSRYALHRDFSSSERGASAELG